MQNTDFINVLICCDENFVQHAGVFMNSVLANTASPERMRFFWIADQSVTASSREKLRQIVEARHGRLEVITPDLERLKSAYISNQYSVATYYRLMIGEILPADVEKCIYCDCDMIALGDLAELWVEDISPNPIGAVTDHAMVLSQKNFATRREQLGMGEKDHYFNAGLLVIDLKAWREGRFGEKTLQLATTRQFRSHDQDVLNMVFCGNWHVLPSRWNCMPAIYGFHAKLFMNLGRFPDVVDARKRPGIVHYAGRYKPWEFPATKGFNDVYYRYLAETPFAATFVPKKSPQNEKKTLRGELTRIGIGNVLYGLRS